MWSAHWWRAAPSQHCTIWDKPFPRTCSWVKGTMSSRWATTRWYSNGEDKTSFLPWTHFFFSSLTLWYSTLKTGNWAQCYLCTHCFPLDQKSSDNFCNLDFFFSSEFSHRDFHHRSSCSCISCPTSFPTLLSHSGTYRHEITGLSDLPHELIAAICLHVCVNSRRFPVWSFITPVQLGEEELISDNFLLSSL